LCKAERRLSVQWDGLCKRCESSLLMRPWWPPAPLLCAQIHTWGGAGRKARGIVGSERASRRGDVAARRKMANRSGGAQCGILPSGCSRRGRLNLAAAYLHKRTCRLSVDIVVLRRMSRRSRRSAVHRALVKRTKRRAEAAKFLAKRGPGKLCVPVRQASRRGRD